MMYKEALKIIEMRIYMKKEIIMAQNAPAAVGPYVHAVKAGDLIFTSGQLGLNPENGFFKCSQNSTRWLLFLVSMFSG